MVQNCQPIVKLISVWRLYALFSCAARELLCTAHTHARTGYLLCWLCHHRDLADFNQPLATIQFRDYLRQ